MTLNTTPFEDLAIGLGEALNKVLANREGITRFGYATVPMDDSIASAAVDMVKRPYAVIDLKLRGKKIEDMATEDIVHFFLKPSPLHSPRTFTYGPISAVTTTTKQKPPLKPCTFAKTSNSLGSATKRNSQF